MLGDRKKKDGPDDAAQAPLFKLREVLREVLPWCQGLAKENRALKDSASALDEVLEQAGSILGNLVGELSAFTSLLRLSESVSEVNQNKVLKNARRKLLDAANSIGAASLDRKSLKSRCLGLPELGECH